MIATIMYCLGMLRALRHARRERARLRKLKDGFYYEFYLRCDSSAAMADKAIELMPTADRAIIGALVEAANNNGYSEGQGF